MTAIREFFEKYPWVLIAIIVHLVVLGTVAYLILLERKVASWVQDRIGPNRVGPWGLLQPLADGMKFIFKEDYRPAGVDRILFTVAPALMISVVIVSVAVIPWGGIHEVTHTYDITTAVPPKAPGTTEARPDAATLAVARSQVPSIATLVGAPKIEYTPQVNGDYGIVVDAPKTLVTITYRYPFQIADLNIGILFIIGILSLAVYGVVLGGWASNNKYSFLGGLRATAQMISYEIPLGLCVLCIVTMFGTLNLGTIVDKQAHYWAGVIPAWNVFSQPLAFLMFLVCIHAEANRAPFDLAEAEQELVGGYHTEYSSMRFALFFLAEYAGMITTSAVCVALFFGGWHIWGLNGPDPLHPSVTTSLGLCVLRAIVFFIKTLLVIFVFMWVRWSLPRFRFDQLMMLAWRAMIPISLALLVMTAIVVYSTGSEMKSYFEDERLIIPGPMAILFLVGNIILMVVVGIASTIVPAAPETNRRLRITNSRFARTPLPGGPSSP